MKYAFLTFVVAAAGVASAAPVQWDLGVGGTGKWYDRIDTQGTLAYAQAKAAAETLTFNGIQGQLLVMNGSDPVGEQNWVRDNVVRTAGLPTASTIYWVGATRSDAIGEPRENWTWLDGSSVSATLTATWTVDFFEGAGEYAAGFHNGYGFDFGDYRQDDPANRMGGYIVQYVPSPGSLALMCVGGLVVGRRRR